MFVDFPQLKAGWILLCLAIYQLLSLQAPGGTSKPPLLLSLGKGVHGAAIHGASICQFGGGGGAGGG